MISWLRTKVATQYSKLIPKDKIIGIGGSFAQRETAYACRSVLSFLGEVVSTSNYSDSDSAISQALLKITPQTKKAIIEFKVKRLGQIQDLLKLVKPEVAVILGVDYSNAETMGNFEQIFDQTEILLAHLPPTGATILNWDSLESRKLADKTKTEIIFFGTDKKNCHIWAGNIALNNYQISFELNYGVERVEINTSFIGKHQIYPLLAAAALGIREGLRLTQIKKALESLAPLEHQLKLYKGFNGSLILDDSWEDSSSLAEQALEVLNYLPARRRILVLGEIKRLGSLAEKVYKNLARRIYQEKLDLVLVEKGQAKIAADELLKLGFIADRMESDLINPQIVTNLLNVLAKGDLVLIIGSRELRLDEVVKKITKKD